MKIQTRQSAIVSCLCALLLSACAAKQVAPEDRDRSGSFDGAWLAEVGGPNSTSVLISGKSKLTCEWDPFNVRFDIKDGMVTVPNVDAETGISSNGRFLYELLGGAVTQRNGVAAGNPRITARFSAALAGEEPKGSYTRLIKSLGANGCTADILYSRLE